MSDRLLHALRFFLVVGSWLAICLSGATSALAQETTGGGGGGGPKYVLPYFIVILAIFLGVFVVCRSSRRRDRAKPEEYAQKTFLGKE